MKAYEFDAGPHEILVLSDGHLVLPTFLLAPGAPGEERDALLRTAALTGETYEPAANVPLIRTGSDLILFDTGGTGYQPQLGRLADNLAGAGIDPATITKVVLTHGHPDHIGGTVLEDGSLRFPNAAYFAGPAEWDFWNGEDVWTKLPDAQHPFAVGARRQYAAIKDRVTMMRAGDEVVSGIRAIATPGHTTGHLSFEVAGGEGLIIVGDVVTAPSVYFPHPDWKFGFDADHDKAIASRNSLLARASSDRTKLLGYHWPYPGVGYAERNGTAYHYVPAHSDGAASREPPQ
jgi:glyoxylase-like metal-dependent hydrolase (beta-lactamase superfamily II)